MGLTAMRRARSWLGLPYSWAGGNSRGPTLGVCAHNGGDLDCHVVGFDCSGLALYAWAPYKQLVHYAATQHSRAGRFHPAIGELVPGDLVFFSSYIPNGIGHVAIYEGHGWVIQAEQSGYPIMRSRLVDVIAASGHYRGATRPTSTGREGPVPHLSAVTPQLSVKGGYVTLTGSRLAGATSVTIGGTRIYSFASRTYHHLRVKAPAHRAGRVKVTVYNAWGGASRTLTYIGAPRVTSVSPASGPVTGGTPITLAGADLGVATTVTVDGRAVRFAATSATRLTITSPAHAAGAVPIVVSSRYGTAKPVTFTYVAAATPAGRVTRSGAGTGGSSSPPPASPPSSGSSSPPSSSPPATGPPPPSSSPPATGSPPPSSSPPVSSPSGPPPSGSTVSGSAAAPGSPPG
jgi:cell wall-associated NlpC family hydrolase